MKPVRRIRKSLTVNTLRLGLNLARKGDEKTIERISRILNGFMKAALPLRIMLRTNIKSTGLSPDSIVDEIDAYFKNRRWSFSGVESEWELGVKIFLR